MDWGHSHHAARLSHHSFLCIDDNFTSVPNHLYLYHLCLAEIWHGIIMSGGPKKGQESYVLNTASLAVWDGQVKEC